MSFVKSRGCVVWRAAMAAFCLSLLLTLAGPMAGLQAKAQDPTNGAGTDQTGSGLGAQGLAPQGMSTSTVPRGVNLQNGLGTQNTLNGQNGQNANQTQQYPYNNDAIAAENLNRLLPPDPPTEFQRMVESSTGKRLPIYGARLFRYSPSTFAPLDKVPVTPDYTLGPGDELLIQVWGQVTLNGRFTIDRAGNIYIPQVGTLRVAGLTFGQIQDYLKAQMGKVFRNFDLNVNMGQLRSIQVFVVGQARRPGSYTVSSLSTLVSALFVTGGPTPQGSFRHIQLKRGGKVIVDYDLYDLLERGEKTNDTQLMPGDVIYIPPVGPQVAMVGSVNSPGIYELRAGTTSTVGDVLELAAGPTITASDEKARIERVSEHRVRSVVDLTLDSAGLATPLKDGDVVEVVAIIDRFKNGVTLRGNVANPGHYAWKPGMRVTDLIPNKDSLITRDYWLKHGRLGEPTLTYLPNCPVGAERVGVYPNGPQGYGGYGGYGGGANNVYGSQSSSATAGTGQTQNQAPYGSQGGVVPGQDAVDTQDCIPDTSTSQFGLNAGYAVSAAQQQGNSGYSPQSLPAGVGNQSGAQYGVAAQNGNQAGAAGGVAQPSASRGGQAAATVGRAPGDFAPRYDVKLSAPDIDWSYAVIERQNKDTLKTELLPFNLGKLVLDGDNSQNLELMPGDVVTIFSKADFRVPQAQQTRLVRLEGEFVASGVYSVEPGETLRQLVKRAGGFSPDAYLYGSEFTRESTRRLQQQRLNDYVDQISLQAATASVNAAGSAVSPLDSAAAAATQTQSQSVINSLRQARASGRIVLNLHPDSSGVDQIPEIPLEDGDSFIVPHLPSTVSVAGAVYNPNSFVYAPHRRLRDYLRLAGGANRDADTSRAYVIRADGSVVSKQQISSFRRTSFDSLRIYPGDTVVVPLNLSKGTSLRTIVDVAQIVGQFGVAIAALGFIL